MEFILHSTVPKNNPFHQFYHITTFKVAFSHPSGLTVMVVVVVTVMVVVEMVVMEMVVDVVVVDGWWWMGSECGGSGGECGGSGVGVVGVVGVEVVVVVLQESAGLRRISRQVTL